MSKSSDEKRAPRIIHKLLKLSGYSINKAIN